MSLITVSRENSNNSLNPSISSPTDQNQQLTTNNRIQSVKVNDRNSVAVPKLTDNGESLIQEIKNLAISLKHIGSDNKKLHTIKGYEELIGRIEEVIVELDEQFKNIVAAIKIAPNRIVSEVWKLRLCMYEIQEFFDAVDKSWLFISKSKMKLRMQNHYQSLRARCTQLFTAISLELLTDKPIEEPPRLTSSTELYRIGLQYYYGLSGKPKNYIFAFEKFIQAAEYGDVEAMIQTGKCYLIGHGTDKNEDFGIKWLEKAIESASSSQECAHAKTEIALFIIEKLKEKSPRLVKEFFHGTYQQPIELQGKKTKKSSGPGRRTSTQSYGHEGDEKADEEEDGKVEEEEEEEEGEDEGIDDALEQSLLSVSNILDTERSYLDDEPDNPSVTSSPNRRFLRQHRNHVHDLGQDLQTAMKLLVAAAKDGHIEAKTHLGLLYEEGDEYEQAAKWYSLASNGGSSLATCKLGTLLIHGKSQYFGNKQKAYSLFMMASKHEQREAFNGLGMCYEYGIGVDIHLPLAIDYYRQAAQLMYPRGMFNCGYLLVKMAIDVMDTRKTTHEKVKRMKDQGYQQQLITATTTNTSADASIVYGGQQESKKLTYEEDDLYDEIDHKTLQALEEGIRWLRGAAEHQVAEASYQLGRLYEQAIGVPKDLQSSLAHYIHAAKHGHARSALLAANLLYKQQEISGTYTYATMKQISKLYHQAALAGLADAMNSFALLLEDGRASPHGTKDLYLAAAWYYQACLADYVPAFLNLAMLLATDQLYSFQSIEGDLITLDEARHFLAKHLPILQLSDEKMDIYQHLLSDISQKADSAVPVVVGGMKEMPPPVQDTNHPLWLRSPASNEQLQYPPGSLREDLPRTVKPAVGPTGSQNTSIHSLVLMDPTEHHQHQHHHHPHLGGNHHHKLSTVTSKYTNNPHQQHHQHQQQQQRHSSSHHHHGTGKATSTHSHTNNNTLSRHVSFPTTVTPSPYTGSAHHKPPSSSSSAAAMQSRPLPSLPTTLVHPPPSTYHSYFDSDVSLNGEELVYKSGDYYLTNGEIPPPNYVPRPMMHIVPTLATKPGHASKSKKSYISNSSANSSALSISIPTSQSQDQEGGPGSAFLTSSLPAGPPSTIQSHFSSSAKGNVGESSRPPRLPSPQPTPHVHPNHARHPSPNTTSSTNRGIATMSPPAPAPALSSALPVEETATRRTSFGAKMWSKLVSSVHTNNNTGNPANTSTNTSTNTPGNVKFSTDETSTNPPGTSPYPVQTSHGMSLAVPDLK